MNWPNPQSRNHQLSTESEAYKLQKKKKKKTVLWNVRHSGKRWYNSKVFKASFYLCLDFSNCQDKMFKLIRHWCMGTADLTLYWRQDISTCMSFSDQQRAMWSQLTGLPHKPSKCQSEKNSGQSAFSIMKQKNTLVI